VIGKFIKRTEKPPADLPAGFSFFRESFGELLRRFEVDGPVCHVGAKDQGGSPEAAAQFRRNFARLTTPEVVGLDIFPGLNVDLVADVCAPDLFETHAQLKGRFGLVYCSALLEHVQEPFAAARNIAAMLRPGGQLYYTGPWVWGYHPYPDDYWRISFPGLKLLFPALEWRRRWYSGTLPKVGIAFEDSGDERLLFQQQGAKGVAGQLSDRAMPYLNINAIGRLAPAQHRDGPAI
jgi:SAM-dependent methyltransferase